MLYKGLKRMKLPVALTVFKPILSKIKNSGVILLILLWLALLIFVWWKGSEFSFNEYKPFETLEGRWLTTAILIIVAIGFFSWKIVQRLKTLETRQQEDKKKQYNPIKEEIDAQRRYLDHWVNKFKRYVDDQRYHYTLPWYLALGTENSDKETLFKEGGNFSALYNLEDSSTKVHFSLLANQQAVIICPSDNLVSQIDNIEEKPRLYNKLWWNLLVWLKTQRKRQPLNGIILTIDFHELLTSDKPQKEAYLDLLHQRLSEVMSITQGELPIYIIMTKLDTFYGFETIYEGLTKEQREQVLGVTFSQKGENWQQEFSTFWQHWLEQMNNLMPDLLFKATADKRSQIFSYIRQLATANEILSPFFENLVANNGKSFHFLKGIYLTSIT